MEENALHIPIGQLMDAPPGDTDTELFQQVLHQVDDLLFLGKAGPTLASQPAAVRTMQDHVISLILGAGDFAELSTKQKLAGINFLYKTLGCEEIQNPLLLDTENPLYLRDLFISMLANYRHATIMPGPAAQRITLEEAGRLHEKRLNDFGGIQELQQSPELKFHASTDYNRINKHHFVEIDPRQSKAVIMKQLESLVERMQSEILCYEKSAFEDIEEAKRIFQCYGEPEPEKTRFAPMWHENQEAWIYKAVDAFIFYRTWPPHSGAGWDAVARQLFYYGRLADQIQKPQRCSRITEKEIDRIRQAVLAAQKSEAQSTIQAARAWQHNQRVGESEAISAWQQYCRTVSAETLKKRCQRYRTRAEKLIEQARSLEPVEYVALT